MWRFALGYQEKALSEPPALPILFVVLPMCLHTSTLGHILSTRKSSGLGLFVAKIGEVREDLLAIHERAIALRELSLDSIGMGVRCEWLTLNYSSAEVRANDVRPPTVPERIKPMWDGAEKLGYWCGGAGLKQATTLLRVDF